MGVGTAKAFKDVAWLGKVMDCTVVGDFLILEVFADKILNSDPHTQYHVYTSDGIGFDESYESLSWALLATALRMQNKDTHYLSAMAKLGDIV